MQLNGELNSVKLAVPQLMNVVKNATGGVDASMVTADVSAAVFHAFSSACIVRCRAYAVLGQSVLLKIRRELR